MQSPLEEISSVVQQLTATSSPDVQEAAVERYLTADVGFRHPVCSVTPSPNSRDEMLGIYQWYRVLSPRIEVTTESIVFNTSQNVMYLECVQWFRFFFLPVEPAPARLVIRLTLRKEKELYYIAFQEDFYHPDDFAALLLPPIAPVVRVGLALAGYVSHFLAKTAQVFGFWSTQSVRENGSSEENGPNGLYDFKRN